MRMLKGASLFLSLGVAVATCVADTRATSAQAPVDERAAATARLMSAAPAARIYQSGAVVSRVYGTAMAHGANPVASAETFRTSFAGVLGATPEDLVPGTRHFEGAQTIPLMYDADTDTYKFTLVYYDQMRDGVPVFGGDVRVVVRNEDGFPTVLVASGARDLGTFHIPANVSIDISAGEDAALALVPSLTNFYNHEPVIWAGLEDQTAAPRLAVSFIADNAAPPAATTEKWLFVCDAATGEVLHRESKIIFEDVVGTVTGLATEGFKSDTCNAEVSTPLPYATVSITGGSTVYANVNGAFVIPNAGTTAVTVNSPMSGHYFYVDNVAGTEDSLSSSVTPPGPANFVHNSANSAEFVRAQTNGYVQANVVRDFTLAANPSYPTVAGQTNWPVYVNRNDGYCPANAWYDGVSINFCRASGSYPNTAYTSVVHHEYGHHLVEMAGSGQDQYGEGMGDVMSVLISDDPILGYGFTGSCSAGIRTASNTMQYPCSDEAHACAPLLSGAVWETRNELIITEPANYRTILRDIAVNAMLLHTGSTIAPDITIDYLTLDDNNSDIYDGTPHYFEIATGFGEHNLDAPAISPLDFNYPNGLPSLVTPDQTTSIRVDVAPLGGQPEPGTGLVYYRVNGGSWTNVAMSQGNPNEYTAVLPAVACGGNIDFYFAAQTNAALNAYDPAGAPSAYYSATSATGSSTVFQDQMETNLGWTAGATGDTATTGIWNRMDPQATSAQPEDDHTASGTICWVTNGTAGASDGANDVDGGKTTLLSPVIDLSTGSFPRIGYWRWYDNAHGGAPQADTFRVDITNNGTTWVNVETVGPTGAEASGGWYYHEFAVTSFVTPTATVRMRFIAEDAATASLIEAAVDDFMVVSYSCESTGCEGDIDGDGNTGPQDLALLLSAFDTQQGDPLYNADADLNTDTFVDAQDLALLLADWECSN